MFVEPAVRQAQEVRVALRRQVERLRPGEVPLGDAAAVWQVYDGIERLASAAKVLLAGRVDESRVWAREGDRSAADYLARVSGSSRGVSRSLLDTSRRLPKTPATEAALRRGQLSRPQAEAIADAAATKPSAEDELLAAASRESLAELRERCARVKAKADPDPDATYARIHRQRRLRQFTDAEGAWNAMVRGTPDAGAVFNAALKPIVDELFQQARREGRSEPRETYAFDAMLELARRAHDWPEDPDDDLDRDDVVANGDDEFGSGAAERRFDRTEGDDAFDGAEGDDGLDGAGLGGDRLDGAEGDDGLDGAGLGGDRSKRRRGRRKHGKGGRRRRPVNPSHLALLRVDLEALRRGRVEGDELCEITGLGPIPVRVARGLLGDAVLKLVVTKGVDVAHVTHLGRGPTAAQRVAALWVSPFCTNQGCPNVVNIQHDHREPWAQVHKTEIGNLDRLCGACHWLKTHEGWALVEGKGRRPLVPPDDPRHPRNQMGPHGSHADASGHGTTNNTIAMPPQAARPGSHAAVSVDRQPPARPAETLRPDSTLFDNSHMTPAA